MIFLCEPFLHAIKRKRKFEGKANKESRLLAPSGLSSENIIFVSCIHKKDKNYLGAK